MSGNFPYRSWLWLALAACLCGGCGGPGGGAPAGVAGKVAYRGKPIGTGTIVFVPDASRGTNGAPICATIGADGGYRLHTEPATGVPAGWYRVTVAAVGVTPTGPGQSYGTPYSLLPDKYRDPELSGLQCEVKPGRENAINFNLD